MMVRLRNSNIRPLVAKIIFHGNKETLSNQQRLRCHKNEFFISFKNNRNVSEQAIFLQRKILENLAAQFSNSFASLKVIFRGPSLFDLAEQVMRLERHTMLLRNTQNKLKCWACKLCSLLFLRLNLDGVQGGAVAEWSKALL